MTPLGVFLACSAVYIGLALLAVAVVRGSFQRRLQELDVRYRALQTVHEQALRDLEAERGRADGLGAEAERLAQLLDEREGIFRGLLPAAWLTPVEILRIRRQVGEDDIRQAREHIMSAGRLVDLEDVLLETKTITPVQLAEVRALIARYRTPLAQPREP